jgi:GAF domain-containing protein
MNEHPAAPLPAARVPQTIDAMTNSTNLVTDLERLADALAEDTEGSASISLPAIADRIAQNIGVKKDEVAILGFSLRWRHLKFLVPEALKPVGSVPLSSNSALAARTARESRPEILNNFVTVRHASVFEGVKLGQQANEAIQKIISAPILADGTVIGVIQISRKGPSAAEAGPDFTPDDLGKVLALCKPLGKLLQHVSAE